MDSGLGRFLWLWVEAGSLEVEVAVAGRGLEQDNHHQLRVCYAFLRSHTVIIYL